MAQHGPTKRVAAIDAGGRPAERTGRDAISDALVEIASWRDRPNWWLGPGVGLAAAGAGAVVRLALLGGSTTRLGYVTFYSAVAIAAMVGGPSGGILATLFCAFTVHYFFAPLAESTDMLGLFGFLVNCAVVIGITEMLHRVWTRVAELKVAATVQERLAAIIASSSDAILSMNLDGVVTSWNAGAMRLLGYGAEEMIGRSTTLLIPPERLEEEAGIVARIRAGESIENFETSRLAKDGREIHVSMSCSALKDAAGEVVGISTIVRDIGDRKRVEDALRESLKNFTDLRAALDEHAIVAITDRRGVITYVNDKFCEISKYSREELLGQDHLILNSRFHAPEVFRDLWTRIASGGVWRGELRNRAKDGSFYWVDTTIVPFLDAEGNPRQYVAIRADISERKRVEELLIESQLRTRLATEAAEVGVWEWNTVTNVIRWDAQMFRIYGITPTEDGLVSYDIWAGAVLPQERARQAELLRKHAREGGVNHREFRIRRKDNGECRDIQAVETLGANAPGHSEWLVGTNLDVTDRKRAGQALRESEERMRFALSGAQAAAWQWNILTNEHRWSPESYLLHGRDPKLGSPSYDEWLACLHPDDRAPIQLRVRDVLEGRAAELRLEYRVIFPTGEQRWLAGLGKVEYAPDGVPVRISGINLDITEQKRAEDEMQRLNRTLQAYSAGGWALARASDETSFVNEFCRIVVEDCGHAMVWVGYAENDEISPLGPWPSPAARTAI